MPLFNRAHFVGEAIDSVLGQTFKEWELVIVNDGSTDGSLEVARTYAERDQRIRVIDQPNSGLVAARNNGISAAVGEYIFPLDDDDKISPDALSELFVSAKLELGDVICCETERFGAQQGLLELQPPTQDNMPYGNCVVCSALYKKSDWEKYGGYDANMKGGFEDWEFWLNFVADDKIFYRIPKSLFYYRITPGTMSHKVDKVVKAQLKKYLRKKHYALYKLPPMKLAWSSRLFLVFVKIFQSEQTYRRIRRQLSIADYPTIN